MTSAELPSSRFVELAQVSANDICKVRNIVLEAEYADTLGHSRDSLSALLRSKGYNFEANNAAQIMIYAWRT